LISYLVPLQTINDLCLQSNLLVWIRQGRLFLGWGRIFTFANAIVKSNCGIEVTSQGEKIWVTAWKFGRHHWTPLRTCQLLLLRLVTPASLSLNHCVLYAVHLS
jgi:hypothetical protein